MSVEVDLRDTVNHSIKILTFFGVISPKLELTKQRILHYLRVAITGILLMSVMMSQLANLVVSLNKGIQDIVTATYISAANSFTLVKVCFVIKHRGQLLALINNLNREEFKPRSIHQCNVIYAYIKTARIVTIALFALIGIAIIFYIAFPFTAEGGPFLPSPSYIPYNVDKSPIFEITFVGEIIGTWTSACCNLSVDSIITGFFTAICAQLTLLNDSLVNLSEDLKNQNPNEVNGKTVDDIMNMNLVRCVNQHRCILQLANEIQSIFTVPLFGQFFVSVLILCTTLFQMSMVGKLDLSFAYMINYQGCILLQIFLPCYFGNKVILKHQQLTNSVYHCKWMHASETFKKKLLFFMTRSQKDLQICAGGYITLSNATFVNILKSSVSYYTVLETMNNKQV